jgi:glycosyltransferase involved in cell wall biosynthesis
MKISIIICSKDRSHQLTQCLHSVSRLEGVEEGCELILVNNQSKDDTQRVMESFARSASFPVAVISENRPGLSHGRNAGIRSASGDVLFFTDDDCLLDGDYLKALKFRFEQEDVDYAGGQVVPADPDHLQCTTTFDREKVIPPYSFIPAGMIKGANMVFRKKVNDRIGWFDPFLGLGAPLCSAEDSDYLARISWAGFRGVLDPNLIVFHHHGRKSGSVQHRRTQYGYDVGRGAFLWKCILRGDLSVWRHWFAPYFKKEAPRERMFREISGAGRYLILALLNVLKVPGFPKLEQPES